MVQITIDGKKTEAKEGTTILDAAEMAGIHIPNLCYLKGMKGIGACRLCLVEIEGLKMPMTACTTKVKEGMSITTSTPEIEETRKFVIDLILSMHPMDCMTCTKAGICRLQEYAYRYNLKETNYSRKLWNFPVDNKNPLIKREPDYCILCARCVRVCKDQGTKILDFMGRGVGSKVTTPNDKPLQDTNCTFCGSCVDVCPVNALSEADRTSKGREWELKKIQSTCTFCGCACSITVSTQNDTIAKINSGHPSYETTSYICAYGRFGFDYVDSKDRVLKPMIRRDGALQEVSVDEAVDTIVKALNANKKDTAFVVNGSLLTEDAIALVEFANRLSANDRIFSTTTSYYDAKALSNSDDDLDGHDLLVVVNLKTSQASNRLPGLDAIIRRMASSGISIVTIGETSFSEVATVNLSGDPAEVIRSLVAYLCKEGVCTDKKLQKSTDGATINEEIQKAGKAFIESNNPLVLSTPAMALCAANLAYIKGSLLSVPFESNAVGIALTGINRSFSDLESLKPGPKLYYVIGDSLMTKKPEGSLLIVHTTHMTELAKEADVVLPLTTPYESSGTIISAGLKVKQVNQSLEPKGMALSPRDAFQQIVKAMGEELKLPKNSEVKKLLKGKHKVEPTDFKKIEGLTEDISTILTAVNHCMLQSERIAWLEQNRKRLGLT